MYRKHSNQGPARLEDSPGVKAYPRRGWARRCWARRGSARRGSVVVWLVLGLAVLLGVVAICIDGGRTMEERRRAQTAADAAALAAAAELYANYWQPLGNGTAQACTTAAVNAAVANGFPASAVQVSVPPQSGAFAGRSGYVEVVLRYEWEAGFGKIFTQENLAVQARAVAIGQPMQIGVILLRPHGASAFLNNAAAFTLVNTPLIVDSDDPAAYTQASFGAVVASRIDVTGNYVNPGGALLLARVRTGVQPTPDPLAFLPIADANAAIERSKAPLTINSLLPVFLQPGVYRGGIYITGTSIVTMAPGVYIMDGGGFRVDGQAVVAGLEVMVYNTSGSYPAGPIQVQSTGKVILTAPLSGTYQGVSLFQNRAMANAVSVTGFGLTTITGVVYARGAPVQLTGSAAAGVDILGGAFVCDSMTASGLGGINIDLNLNPPRVPDVRLVE